MPVFFIQDGIKFPDLVHAVKPEPHHEMPQAASAHDTFWDFVSLVPETMHMVMWLMSDRALPRSYRMMEGFGVHTFRLVNAERRSVLVKFHWKPVLGTHSLLWDEAQKISGKDPDFHRRDLWEAIESGNYPEYELGLQVMDEDDQLSMGFDLLDATKLVPEELVPVRRVGKLTLDRNPQNFFAETEQVAFCVGNIVPGIDFTNDPLLHARLFSYLDTQLLRLGGPNFTELPINRPVVPGRQPPSGWLRPPLDPHVPRAVSPQQHREQPTGACVVRAGIHSLRGAARARRQGARAQPFVPRPLRSSATLPAQPVRTGARPSRGRVPLRARQGGTVGDPGTRRGVVCRDRRGPRARGRRRDRRAAPQGRETGSRRSAHRHSRAGEGQGEQARAITGPQHDEPGARDGPHAQDRGARRRRRLEERRRRSEGRTTRRGRRGGDRGSVLGPVRSDEGLPLDAQRSFLTTSSVLYDAVFIPGGKQSVATLGDTPAALEFVQEAYRHAKPIGALNDGMELLAMATLPGLGFNGRAERKRAVARRGVVTAAATDTQELEYFATTFIDAIRQHRHFDRPIQPSSSTQRAGS
jgi:catalase